jgi:hypothetical protein
MRSPLDICWYVLSHLFISIISNILTLCLRAYFSKVLPQGPPLWEEEEDDPVGSQVVGLPAGSGSKLPPSVNAWEVLGAGVMPEISELRMLVVTSKSAEQRLGTPSR